MTDHPLTDRMIQEIQIRFGGHDFTSYDDMRAAYDLAIVCFSDWIRENGHEYVSYHHELGAQSDFERMIADFNQTMRPQEDNQ